MKQFIFLLGTLTVLTLLTGCGKKDQPAPPVPVTEYSYWMVNDDTIAYNKIAVSSAPSLTELRVMSSQPLYNWLSFAFQMGSLPRYGTYKVDYVASDPYMCNVYVDYKGNRYDVDPANNITSVRISTLSNGKGRYELEPTWFYKHLAPSDSIRVQAVIIEP